MIENKFLFQLIARGDSIPFPGTKFELRTKTIYTTEGAAMDRMSAFKDLVTDRSNFDYVSKDTLEIIIQPLELVQ